MWNFKNDTNELIYKTETDSQTLKINLWLPKEKGGGRNRWGVWEWQRHIFVYGMGGQWGPAVQHREFYSMFCDNLYGNGDVYRYG